MGALGWEIHCSKYPFTDPRPGSTEWSDGFTHMMTSVNQNETYTHFLIPTDFLNNLPICCEYGTPSIFKVSYVSSPSCNYRTNYIMKVWCRSKDFKNGLMLGIEVRISSCSLLRVLKRCYCFCLLFGKASLSMMLTILSSTFFLSFFDLSYFQAFKIQFIPILCSLGSCPICKGYLDGRIYRI